MKGCLLRFVLLAVVVGVLYPLLALRSPLPTLELMAEGVGAAAIVTGFLVWLAILSMLDVRQARADLRMLNQPPRDGERLVASGTLDAIGPQLEAPLSGDECAGYHCVVRCRARHTTESSSWWPYYEGYALTPSQLVTPSGSFKILAEPDKELFHEVPEVALPDALERARSYVSTTEFGTKEQTGPGGFRVDEPIREAKDLDDARFYERTLKAGEPVLAVGVYSSTEIGIRPHPDGVMHPFHLVPGGEGALRNKVRSRLKTGAISLALALVVVGVYFAYFVPRHG
jgi:hypothetical protein